ncbi:hypothetical protein [Bacillus sp. ISL-46]|uniref:hypothetical protein n=1 Tax=Bacillus sp. ISL-46 TaxID=2819129 RepID=UPI001BEACB30|nr:hypothetical protein [Bacillus sp. ISL-46]MBT2722317.1 hypothetical protein [Bacillus sp. ISL-46]
MSAILDLPLSLSYIKHAIDKETENTDWQLWMAIYPHMMMEKIKFMSFDEFKQKLHSPVHKHSDKTYEEIGREMDDVIASYEGKVK